MTRALGRLTIWAALTAAAVVLAWLPVGSSQVAAAAAGAALALAVQLALAWLLFVRIFPAAPLAAYGIGALGRMLLLGVAAFSLVPRSGFAAWPFLLSLVAVLAVTTVLEAVVLVAPATSRGRGAHAKVAESPTRVQR